MKAFLSHSSTDKEFVEAVAVELGRQFCVFDKASFDSGTGFIESISMGLDESSLLVLFATKAALKSTWVQFELDEAKLRQIQKSLGTAVVYLLSKDVSFEDLPEWLRRARAVRENSPKAVARDIRHHLNHLISTKRNTYFVGRANAIQELEEALTPIDASTPPRVLLVSGLPGIGRRTLIRKCVPSLLNLHKTVDIPVGEGDTIIDICISVANEAEPYNTKAGFETIVNDIRKLRDEDAIYRILNNLRTMTSRRELPIFVDNGGIIDNEGDICRPIQSLIQSLATNDDAYFFTVSRRRPKQHSQIRIPCVTLPHLAEVDIKRLLKLTLAPVSNSISNEQLSQLAEFIAGYPPAAYFASIIVRQYGIELTLKDPSAIVRFRTDIFTPHLQATIFTDIDNELLAILAPYSPLPIDVIVRVLSSYSLEKVTSSLGKLIDMSLVVIDDNGYYAIASPVADAAFRQFGFSTAQLQKALASQLLVYLDSLDDTTSQLPIHRVFFRLATILGDKDLSQHSVHLATDLIKLTEELYHAGRYRQAIDVGLTALSERKESQTARSYLIRSYVKQEQWHEAERQLKALESYAPIRDVMFLRGFMERIRGRTQAAIAAYEEAERNGRKGIAVSRELALCYFVLGDLEEASKRIAKATTGEQANRYVIDLKVQIETRRRNEPEARKALEQLRLVDNDVYYLHRLARVELAFGNITEALAAARRAVQAAGSDAPFESLATLTICELEATHIPEATRALEQLECNFSNIRKDIRIGLRCRIEIAKGKHGLALQHLEQIQDKESPFYKSIRRDAIHGQLSGVLSDHERAALVGEFARLDSELSDSRIDSILPFDGIGD